MSTFYIDSQDDDEEMQELYAQALELFSKRKIRLHSRYDGVIVSENDGRVDAAAALATDINDNTVEFSVAVDPRKERRGLAKTLVKEVIRHAKRLDLGRDSDSDSVVVRAEVVNQEAMPPLLRSLGFENVEYNIWELR